MRILEELKITIWFAKDINAHDGQPEYKMSIPLTCLSASYYADPKIKIGPTPELL